jgi:hypothetical protein
MSEEELIKLIKQQIAVEDINVKEVAESEKKLEMQRQNCT